MNIEFPEDSDSSDEDYMPVSPGTKGEVPSEVDSDGDPEDPLSDSEEVSKKGTKRRKKQTKKRKKQAVQEESSESVEDSPEKKVLSEEEKKKHVQSLWESFKKDTGFKKKSEQTTNSTTKTDSVKTEDPKPAIKKQTEKVKITEIFEFAGEEVKVEKEVPVDSAEARLLTKPSGSAPAAKPRGGLGGIGSVLSQLGKKKKITTLEKSKLDWNKFKKEEQIEEELENYKKGKDGYLERQDFLQRADNRRFEIEKEIRTIERNKREMNNVQ